MRVLLRILVLRLAKKGSDLNREGDRSRLQPKSPHFFCEYCGAEVRGDAKICPHCGRFFSSVKCPKCGHVGKPDDFSFGCPGCGYSLPANPAPEPMKAYEPAQAAPPLPWWVFVAVAAVLLVLCLALASTLI